MASSLIIVDGKLFLKLSENYFEIKTPSIDVLSELGISECHAHSVLSYLETQQEHNSVPAGFEDKYCLLWRGDVFKSFDTKEELEIAKTMYPNLSFTEYHPHIDVSS